MIPLLVVIGKSIVQTFQQSVKLIWKMGRLISVNVFSKLSQSRQWPLVQIILFTAFWIILVLASSVHLLRKSSHFLDRFNMSILRAQKLSILKCYAKLWDIADLCALYSRTQSPLLLALSVLLLAYNGQKLSAVIITYIFQKVTW